MEELLIAIPSIVIIVGLVLFFSPLIIIARLGKISYTLQEMNERSKKKMEDLKKKADA